MTRSDLCELDATGQAEQVHRGDIDPGAPVAAALRRIDILNPQLNCLVSDRREVVADEVAAVPADATFRGVPILVKDLGAGVAGEQMWNSNRLLRARDVVATQDSHVVANLRAAGFAILGRTNTAEFGCNIATEPHATGPTRNPWNHAFSAGGSSGGSAAAVAAGFAPVAHGTDASGSVRIPASACGVVGLKPTSGRIRLSPEDHGGWHGLATSGVLARTVRDVVGVLAAMEDGRRSGLPGATTNPLDVQLLDARDAGHEENAVALQVAEDLLRSQGHRVSRGVPPFMADHLRFHRDFVRAVGIGLADELDAWEERLGEKFTDGDLEPSTRALARLGRDLTEPEREATFTWIEKFRRETSAWWASGPDLVVTPVLATGPVRLGWFSHPIEGGRRVRDAMRFTPQFNVSGDPAMSLPLHRCTDGMPVGVQIVAGHGRDELLLSVARDLEAMTGWNTTAWPPPDDA